MFCFLVIYENLQVIEVALTVITPWTLNDLFKIRVAPFLLAHVSVCESSRTFGDREMLVKSKNLEDSGSFDDENLDDELKCEMRVSK